MTHSPCPDAPSPERVGVVEWFMVGEYERAERVLDDLLALGVRHVRTAVSWADWFTEPAGPWYGWLLPRIQRDFQLLPCLVYTPPSFGVRPHTSSPPWAPNYYAHFVQLFIDRFGGLVDWVELWNEPNCLSEWDWTLDPDWSIFCEMVGPAAQLARERGLKVALGGMSPPDRDWLTLMGQRGLLDHVDAVGVHGFPGTWESRWEGWEPIERMIRSVLADVGSSAEVWITETGYSTWQGDEGQQLAAFAETVLAPVERCYWYCAQDLHPARHTVDGFHNDEREYHFGLRREDGEAKLLHRVWSAGGPEGVADAARIAGKPAGILPATVVAGGGAVGIRLARELLARGRRVRLLDDLVTEAARVAAAILRAEHTDSLEVQLGLSARDGGLGRALAAADSVVHIAEADATGPPLSAVICEALGLAPRPTLICVGAGTLRDDCFVQLARDAGLAVTHAADGVEHVLQLLGEGQR